MGDDWDDWDDQDSNEEAKAISPANRNKFINMMKDNTKDLKAESCTACQKQVPPTDLIRIETKPYHKNCLRCKECNKVLTLGSFAALEGTYYCKPHFKQLFKAKGNYHSGFGTADPKAKWQGSEEPKNPEEEEAKD